MDARDGLIERLDALYSIRAEDFRGDWITAVTDAWPAIRALLAAAPPREPTQAMLLAGGEPYSISRRVWIAMYDAALGAAPVHSDHPLRHWDRTCPACVAEDQSAAHIDQLGRDKRHPDAGADEPGPMSAADHSRLVRDADNAIKAWRHNHNTNNARVLVACLQRARDALAEQAQLQDDLITADKFIDQKDERIAALERELESAKKDAEAAKAAYKNAERRTLGSIASWLSGLAKTERLKHQRNVASELAFRVEYELIPLWCDGVTARGGEHGQG